MHLSQLGRPNGDSFPQAPNDAEVKMTRLESEFPSVDVLAIQDALASSNWSICKARDRLKKGIADGSVPQTGSNLSATSTVNTNQIQARLAKLQKLYPHKARSEIYEVLRNVDWDEARASTVIMTSYMAFDSGETVDTDRPAAKRRTIRPAESSGSEDELTDEDEDHELDGLVDEVNNSAVFNGESDDSDEDVSEEAIVADRQRVLKFYNSATDHELSCVQGCSRKKAELVKSLRPYESWDDLVAKFQAQRTLNAEMLNSALELLQVQDTVVKLMTRCEKITERLAGAVERLLDQSSTNVDSKAEVLELQTQPKTLNPELKLTPYQMIGLNWLALIHRQSVNGILADEMGLGKTIQTISFLAYLKERGIAGPHLIVVPSSTLSNWQNELRRWCPGLVVLSYYGSQEERRQMRMSIAKHRETSSRCDFDVILTTYNMVISSSDDRAMFRKLKFYYAVFDEAHMLKNMATARYENLMRVHASRKLLLTGTPMQNNLVELMSLIVFVMPAMFANKQEHLKKIFTLLPKNVGADQTTGGSDENGIEADANSGGTTRQYELARIEHAKRIMRPFVLRRLKSEVLRHLPPKVDEVIHVEMVERQSSLYAHLVNQYKTSLLARRTSGTGSNDTTISDQTGAGLLMRLRKAVNHPLLIRSLYTDEKLKHIAKMLKSKDPDHCDANEAYIYEDLTLMSDFYIHRTCEHYKVLQDMVLSPETLVQSGKLQVMDRLLPQMKEDGDRVLIFSQFTMILDLMEVYMNQRGHKYLRLDGQTPVQERQTLIDQFSNDESIFIFILSTRAGGLGINLTAANVVLLHDPDFNPYNDRQAEDRCHRVGQTKSVKIVRFVGQDTVEEGMLAMATEKLQLECDLAERTGTSAFVDSDRREGDSRSSTKSKTDLKRLLRMALDVDIDDADEECLGSEQELMEDDQR